MNNKYYVLGETKITHRPQNTENTFFFDGWAIHKIKGGFWLSYIASEHGGGEKWVEINEDYFNRAKGGLIGLDELINCEKLPRPNVQIGDGGVKK